MLFLFQLQFVPIYWRPQFERTRPLFIAPFEIYLQSVHRPRAALLWCSNLTIENAFRGRKLVKIGEGMVGFDFLTNSILLFGFQTAQSFIKIH